MSIMLAPSHQTQSATGSACPMQAAAAVCAQWKRVQNERLQRYLKYSDSVGVREAVQDHGSLQPVEIHPLDSVHVGFGPVDPAVVHRDAVGPPHALRDDAAGRGPVHVASVNAGSGVSPVGPEHQPATGRERTRNNNNPACREGTGYQAVFECFTFPVSCKTCLWERSSLQVK